MTELVVKYFSKVNISLKCLFKSTENNGNVRARRLNRFVEPCSNSKVRAVNIIKLLQYFAISLIVLHLWL